MEIKCINNPYYFEKKRSPIPLSFKSYPKVYKDFGVTKGLDMFIKRPDAERNASGLLSISKNINFSKNKISQFFKNYKKNIKHTYDHKIIYTLIERELYGKNSINCITHDADKLIMYLFGFPRSIVSKIHRKISTHHCESGRQLNLKSMLCDNIASSPKFKPEKKHNLKEYYQMSNELKNIPEFEKLLKKYNYGEDIDFEKIITMKTINLGKYKLITRKLYELLMLLIIY